MLRASFVAFDTPSDAAVVAEGRKKKKRKKIEAWSRDESAERRALEDGALKTGTNARGR